MMNRQKLPNENNENKEYENPLFEPEPVIRDRRLFTNEEQRKIFDAIIEYGTLNRAFEAKALEAPLTATRIRIVRHIDQDFNKRFEEARLIGLEQLFEEALTIAYCADNDIFGLNIDGRPKISYECVNRSRVKVDTIFRILAVINPAKYSEAFYKPRDRLIILKKAKSSKVEDRLNTIYEEVEEGKISPEEGNKVGALLKIQTEVLENKEIMLRLLKLEEAREQVNGFSNNIK